MASVFFSYSHADEELRNELEVHLAMLKREGLVESWHDRRIVAGDDVDAKISSALEGADLILLLVSAHFLASDYCYDIEMQRALQKHREGIARVIPVILHPCDWHSSPFGSLRATPKDGKPISMYANRDEALAEVAGDIRAAITQTDKRHSDRQVRETPVREIANPSTETPRSSNLRVKRTFSEEEVDHFIEESFEYISRFVEGSLGELSLRNPQLTTRYRRIDSNCFTATVYRSGDRVAECMVWRAERNTFQRGIAYSTTISDARTQYNEVLTAENDGFSLYLRPSGMSLVGQGSRDALSQEGAAELYWGLLIRSLQ